MTTVVVLFFLTFVLLSVSLRCCRSPNNLDLTQLDSAEPDWIKQNKIGNTSRSPLFDEYAKRKSLGGSSSHGGINREGGQDVGNEGSPRGFAARGSGNEGILSSSSPMLTAGGRSRVVSTAMKQSMWEAEFLKRRRKEEERRKREGGGGNAGVSSPSV